MRSKINTGLSFIIQVATLVIVLMVWYVATSRKWVSVMILPDLPKLWQALLQILQQPDTYHQLQVTLSEFGGAMAVALGAGFAVGIACGAVRYLGELFEPILLAFYAVPIIMVFPFCILFFGMGSASKIAFGAVYAFFPVAIQTMKGLRHVDRRLIRTAVAMGATGPQLLTKVLVPASLPVIITGVRMGAVLALLGVFAGEMLGALEGAGQQVIVGLETFRTAEGFAWILISILLVALVGGVVTWLERQFTLDENAAP